MKYVLVSSVVAFSLLAADAFAGTYRSSTSYTGYGYSSGSSRAYTSYGYGSERPNYEGYSLRNYGSNRHSRYWRGSTSKQKYNDPTNGTFVEIRAQKLPMPSGNYGRASNRVRVSY